MIEADRVFVSAEPRRRSTSKRRKTLAYDDAKAKENAAIDTNHTMLKAEHVLPINDSQIFMVEQIRRINHDSLLFGLRCSPATALPQSPESPIWHVTLHAFVDGKSVERDYTPVSHWIEWHDHRRLRLLVKIYDGGKMTQHLAGLVPGSTIEVSAPHTTLLMPSLLAPISARPLASSATEAPSHILLFAAGSGVIPMLQIIRELLCNADGMQTVTLLLSNKTYEDLLCWDELCSIRTHNDMQVFNAWLAFSSGRNSCVGPPPSGWPLRGVRHRRIDHQLVLEALESQKTSVDVVKWRAVVSGPEGFFDAMRAICPTAIQQNATFVNLDD